jgi:HAD superfamily hydrolase (TIGR01549 family)
MIRAAIFDLWNTLVHSRGGDPFQHLRELMTEEQRLHFPALKRDAMEQAHASAESFLERWKPCMEMTAAQREGMARVFRAAASDAECFPEALEAMTRTRQVARMGLLSNTQSFDMEFLERLGLAALLPNRFLSAETGFLKPEPQAFETVQKRLGLFPGQLAMVGDSWNDDILGALGAGWTAIWVNREGRPRPEHDPEAELVEVASLAQVPSVIENLQAGARCSTCLG